MNNAVPRAVRLLAIALFTLLMLVSFPAALDTRLRVTSLPPAARSQILARRRCLGQVA